MNFPSISEINSKYKYLLCRLCLCNSGASGTLCDIHGSWVEQKFTAANVISDLLRVEVSTTDGYPQLVCMECLTKLCEFKRFKDKCLNAKTNFEMGLHSNTVLIGVCNLEKGDSQETSSIGSSNYHLKNNQEQRSNASTKENVEGTEFTSEYEIKEEIEETSDIQNENQSDGSPDPLSLDPLKEECNQTSDIQNENQSDDSPDSLSLDPLKEECNQDDNQKTSSVECSDCQAQSNSTKCVSCYLKQQAMERTSMYEYPIQDPHLLQQVIVGMPLHLPGLAGQGSLISRPKMICEGVSPWPHEWLPDRPAEIMEVELDTVSIIVLQVEESSIEDFSTSKLMDGEWSKETYTPQRRQKRKYNEMSAYEEAKFALKKEKIAEQRVQVKIMEIEEELDKEELEIKRLKKLYWRRKFENDNKES